MNPTDPYGRLIDPVMVEEIELLGDVIGAVAAAGHQLDVAEVDRALHVGDTDPEEGVDRLSDALELDAAG